MSRRRRAHAALVWLVLAMLPSPSWAQAGSELAADGSAIPDLPSSRRSYLQASMTRVRAGSLIAGGSDSIPPAPDARGTQAVRRDVVVAQHYAHMAELDVMAELATRGHDVGLAERVEATRRQATQTFFFTLQALRRHILKHQAEVGP